MDDQAPLSHHHHYYDIGRIDVVRDIVRPAADLGWYRSVFTTL